ncbi:MAG: sulfotransferase [Gemmataceae bacterium]
MWQGCSFPAFSRLLWKNGCAVHPGYWYMPLVMTTVSLFNSALHLLQESWFGSRLDQTPLRGAPVFIIGHWRTGTTLLHELLALDPQFGYPTTYDCMAANHFLLTETLADTCFRWMLPTRRPMDNMPVGWQRPQEDEFALCMLGLPSPYLRIAFPNRPPMDHDALDVETLAPRQREAWKRGLLGFLRRVTFRDPRRLILKSPTHSCRIPTLLEMFPGAQFVHIVRNPYVVFASTVRLWQSLYQSHGLQVPTFAGLHDEVLSTFVHLYERIEIGKRLVPPGDFHEVRYEDLIADPLGQMEQLYATLRLPGFVEARPRLEAFWRDQSGYQTNRFPPLDAPTRAVIAQRWRVVLDRYGYDAPPVVSAT